MRTLTSATLIALALSACTSPAPQPLGTSSDYAYCTYLWNIDPTSGTDLVLGPRVSDPVIVGLRNAAIGLAYDDFDRVLELDQQLLDRCDYLFPE